MSPKPRDQREETTKKFLHNLENICLMRARARVLASTTQRSLTQFTISLFQADLALPFTFPGPLLHSEPDSKMQNRKGDEQFFLSPPQVSELCLAESYRGGGTL